MFRLAIGWIILMILAGSTSGAWATELPDLEEPDFRDLSGMVLIPTGKFVMGRNGVNANEEPAHTVYLDAFYIDKYEVAQSEYLRVTGKNPAYFGNCVECPVDRVTFYQAAQYCEKMGKRLPTEAEWEKAARGGTTTNYYWGGEDTFFYAWYENHYWRRGTSSVGGLKPDRYGLHDMAGNVYEWVQDWYHPDYYKKSPLRNPKGPAKGTTKVIRGGSWGQTQEKIAHAYRDSREPNSGYIHGGFRCAKDAGKE